MLMPPDVRRALPALALLACLVPACRRDTRATDAVTKPERAPARGAPGACGHSFCGDNFYVDVDPGPACAPGATCTAKVTLVAVGAFHINDEYPYKFTARDAPGLRVLGTDAAGANVFSKAAGDWRKSNENEKVGTMSVKWVSDDAGDKTLGGVLKLSVCSAQACLLDQAAVQATVAVR
jgi:hypothetical protein